MKTPAQRGPFGAWAYQARLDAELSVAEVVERLGARGHKVSDATIRGVEGGSKKAGARLRSLLAAIYESLPPGGLEVEETEGRERALDVAARLREGEASEDTSELRSPEVAPLGRGQ